MEPGYPIEPPTYTPITHPKCTVNNHRRSQQWSDEDNISNIQVGDSYLEADDEASIQNVKATVLTEAEPSIRSRNNLPAHSDFGIVIKEKIVQQSNQEPVVQSDIYLDGEKIGETITPAILPKNTTVAADIVQAQPAIVFPESEEIIMTEKEALFSLELSQREQQKQVASGDAHIVTSASAYSLTPNGPGTIDSLSITSTNSRRENMQPSYPNDINGFMSDLYARYNRLPLTQARYFGLAFLLISYFIFPLFISGFLFGVYTCLTLFMLYYVSDPIEPNTEDKIFKKQRLEELRQESIKEDCFQKTHKGWMNILNEPYNISTFHYNEIQPVLVRLEGNMLKIQRPEKNMLKHALYDDPTFLNEDPIVVSESIYDLTNAMVKLRPQDLARNRWFSRRYPICIKLASPDCEVHSRNEERFLKLQQEVFEGDQKKHHNPINKVKKMIKKQQQKNKRRRNASLTSASSMDSDNYAPSRAKRYTRQASDIETGYNSDGFYDDENADNVSIASNEKMIGLRRSLSAGNLVSSPLDRLQRCFPGPNSTASRNIYLFARTAREKERWFHVLRKACTKYSTKSMVSVERLYEPGTKPNLPPSFNREYYLYLIKEMEFNRLLNNILTSVNDNRSEDAASGTRSSFLWNSIIRPQENLVIMDLGKQIWNQPAHYATSDFVVVANLLTTRIFYDLARDDGWIDLIRRKAQTKIATLHLPHFMDELVLTNIDMGTAVPKVTKIYSPSVDEWGIWLDVEILYEGSMKMTMETHCDLMKLQSNPDITLMAPSTDGLHAGRMLSMRNTPNAYYDEDVPLSPELSPDEDFGTKIEVRSKKKTGKKTARKLLGIADRLVHSKLAKKVTEIKKVRKTIEKISAKTITINVDVSYVHGTLAVNIPSPPSDRVWYGFRSPPEMKIKTVPQIGDRTIDISKLSDFMESNVKLILAKHIVLPNMDDLVIPTITGDPLLRGPINT